MAGDFHEPVRSIVDGVHMIQYVCGMHFCDSCGDCMHCEVLVGRVTKLVEYIKWLHEKANRP